jgi:hypothetical protein
MNAWFALFAWIVLVSSIYGTENSFWLIEQDFIKIGKRDVYEEQQKQALLKKKQRLQKQNGFFQAYTLEDLENPQYAIFMPLETLDTVRSYEPFFLSDLERQKQEAPGQNLLDTCLNFHIFSLQEQLLSCSYRIEGTFSQERPYLIYLLYDIVPGYGAFFEKHLEGIAQKQQAEKSQTSWRAWKTLLGGDAPKYLICLSFASKDEMQRAKLEQLFEEPIIKEIIRDKRSGIAKLKNDMTYRG